MRNHQCRRLINKKKCKKLLLSDVGISKYVLRSVNKRSYMVSAIDLPSIVPKGYNFGKLLMYLINRDILGQKKRVSMKIATRDYHFEICSVYYFVTLSFSNYVHSIVRNLT